MRVCQGCSHLLKIVGALLILVLVREAHGQDVALPERNKKTNTAVVPGVVIVKFKSGSPSKNGTSVLERVLEDIDASVPRTLFPKLTLDTISAKTQSTSALAHFYEIQYHSSLSPQAVAHLIAQDNRVEFAEPRYRYILSAGREMVDVAGSDARLASQPAVAPNDPQFSEMSHLRHVNMPDAWDIVKASDGNVIIGIVDGGVDWEHTDLVDNVWRNTNEADNGIDDDQNGFVDDLRGWNFPDNSNDPKGLSRTPFNGEHGTMVAGVAAAVTDNNMGISGASWNARFMPINAGCSTVDNAVCFGYEGMLYAALEGADVINVSWGGPDSFLGREVVRIVQEMGALIVVSAGNGGGIDGVGIDIDRTPSFPAAYDGVFVVGATSKETDIKAPFSNFGVSVDVFAPGINLNSTLPENRYTTNATGTSFAVPFVSGLAALVKTQHDDWSMNQVREQIRVTSLPIDEQNDIRFDGLLGSGRIDAIQALTNTSVPSIRVQGLSFVESDADGAIQEGEEVEVALDLFNFLAGASGVSYTVSTLDSLVSLTRSSGTLGMVQANSASNASFAFQLADELPADHTLRFNVSVNGDGFESNELVELAANRVTHDNGVLQVSLTDEGNVGWSGFGSVSEGQGFNYFGVNWLFEGGLLVGAGPTALFNSVRSEDPFIQDNDFQRVAGSKFGIIPGTVTTENGLVILKERGAEEGMGLRIHQESYADTRPENTNFIILRYVLSLSELETSSLEEVYVGLFMDWDLTTGGDFARFDASRQLGLVQPQPEDPILLLGTRLLTSSSGISYRSIRNSEIFDERSGGNGFTDEEKWDFLSGGIGRESVDDDDVSTLIAAGPYRLVPGESIEVAFALLAATNSQNMGLFADNALRLWEQEIRNAIPNPVSVEDEKNPLDFGLDPAFPNPVHSSASIRYSLPGEGHVQIELYDLLGRKIRTLLDTRVFAGVHTIEWDRKNDQGYVVSSGTYVYRITVWTSDHTYTAARPIVVLR